MFEHVFKPAVEGSGLDYECRRSEAARGNVVAAIIRDLDNSHVLIADLTDRNANVFYELGVRHALRNRTIILAQKREDIPFDLQGYGYHVYSWKTQKGKDDLAQRVRELLEEIDKNPERSDSPVSDFLLRDRNSRGQPHPTDSQLIYVDRPLGEEVSEPNLLTSLGQATEKFNALSPTLARQVEKLLYDLGRGVTLEDPCEVERLRVGEEVARPKLLTLKEAAETLGISYSTLHTWLRKGYLPKKGPGGGSKVLVDEKDVIYLKSHRPGRGRPP